MPINWRVGSVGNRLVLAIHRGARYSYAMTREQEILNEIRCQLDKVKTELTGFKVVLFGSRATGTAHERSDFDIGIYGKERVPVSTFYRISDLLDQVQTLYQIDWVDLHETTKPFRQEALKHAKVLYG